MMIDPSQAELEYRRWTAAREAIYWTLGAVIALAILTALLSGRIQRIERALSPAQPWR